jgi:hypothetical protein
LKNVFADILHLLDKFSWIPEEVTVEIPRTAAPSSRTTETEPTPRVSTHTLPAPIGSAYPGTVRCVPEFYSAGDGATPTERESGGDPHRVVRIEVQKK